MNVATQIYVAGIICTWIALYLGRKWFPSIWSIESDWRTELIAVAISLVWPVSLIFALFSREQPHE